MLRHFRFQRRCLGRPVALGLLAPLATFAVSLSVAAFPAAARPSSAPVIESESVTNVTEHDATLQAQIETNGRYTGYDFQLYTIDDGEYNFIQNCPFNLPGYDGCDEYVLIPPPGLRESPYQYIP
jgi:hypothetical protein